MLALACGSIAFAQVPVTPADSAAKAAALGPAAVGAVERNGEFTSRSRWHLTVNAIDKFGLVITGASFQKSPGSPFIYVLFDGRLGEIFVPYHKGNPRYEDIGYEFFNWHPLTLTPAQFPPPRQIIGDGKICKEKRDYLAWMERASNADWANLTTLPGSASARKLSIFRCSAPATIPISRNGRSVTTEPYWSAQARPGPSSANLAIQRPHA